MFEENSYYEVGTRPRHSVFCEADNKLVMAMIESYLSHINRESTVGGCYLVAESAIESHQFGGELIELGHRPLELLLKLCDRQ